DTVVGHVVTFSFDTQPGEKLVIVTAISGTDARGAHSNIVAEAPHDSFERYLADAKSAWNKALKKIEISTGEINEKTVFYTALYHSLLAPVVFSDVDGRYRGPDGVVHQCAEGHKHYSTFSTWDTYRAAHPLYTILEPAAAADMAQSLIDFGIQNGRLPVWNMWASETDMMIGYHSVPIIVDAILKKLPGIDAEAALGECIRTARKDDYRSIGEYRRLGYVPFDKDSIWSLSKTLEYAYDDACIARLAEYLGDDSIYREFTQRAQNYLNVYNSETGFMQPKRSDGSFADTFDPQQYTEDICESNAWQYLWSVQHDIPGLIELLGGKTALEKKLDLFFCEKADSASLPLFSTGMIGQYAHGNEPSHHVAYLYNYTNHPEKGREYLRQIMTTLYKNAPDGLCGNEDCGQMSAWYVFSSFGFYPLDPVSGEYEIGCPMFESAKIYLDNGNTFNVCRKDLNNNTSRKIKHSDIVNDRTIKP
uniref:GH92 family glycosyl hydrolase n=1 Tax=Bacteroides acidifaciens TaxID=85831 RepID=UPI0026F2267B